MGDEELENYRIKHDLQGQQPVFQCDVCGKDMYKDEEYFVYDETMRLCEDCFDIQQVEDKVVAKKYVGDD